MLIATCPSYYKLNENQHAFGILGELRKIFINPNTLELVSKGEYKISAVQCIDPPSEKREDIRSIDFSFYFYTPVKKRNGLSIRKKISENITFKIPDAKTFETKVLCQDTIVIEEDMPIGIYPELGYSNSMLRPGLCIISQKEKLGAFNSPIIHIQKI